MAERQEPPGPRELDALAAAIADGAALDWDALEQTITDPKRRAVLQNLRVLSDIATVHREDTAAYAVPQGAATPRRWAHLELRERVGVGAFGEVYRAWDPKLEREVALKLVRVDEGAPRRLASSEARLLARVRHPNVVTVYGASEADGRAGLWMEFVEGMTLKHLVEALGTGGPHETIGMGLALCGALAAVHAAGMLHGDVKAQNVMRERGGRIVLMDLGAARLRSTAGLGAQLTGTPPYVAPEVLAGRTPDATSDIYSLGVVLFHVLTGSFPYEGRTVAEVREAQAAGRRRSVRELRTDLPDALVSVVERCLASAPEARFGSAAALERALAGCLGAEIKGVPIIPHRQRAGMLLAIGAGLLFMGASGWMLHRALSRPAAVPRLRTSLALVPPVAPHESWIALSRHATYVAYKGQDRRLYVRTMDRLEGQVLPDSEDGGFPFFSPDERWVAYFAGGMLRKFSLVDGASAALYPTPNPRGGTWTEDDWIVFAPSMYEGLWRVGGSRGDGVERLTTLSPGEAGHRWPEALPGGLIAATIWPATEDVLASSVGLYDPERKIWHNLARGTYPRYSIGGQLYFSHDGQLFATPFKGNATERGPVHPVQSLVMTSEQTGFVHYAIGASTLVYSPGGLQSEMRRLVWVDRAGTVRPAVPAARGYDRPRLSPDGRMLAFNIRERGTDIYTYDLARGVLTRLTHGDEAEHEVPVWSPDGSRLIYTAWTRGRDRTYVVVAPGGTEPAQVIARTDRHEHVTAWSPRTGLALVSYDEQGRGDIAFMDAAPPSPRVALASTPYNERDGRLSPDGAWLAYASDESGRDEVYVRQVNGTRRLQVSVGGGSEPVWRRDGHAIHYRSPAAMMEAAWPLEAGVAPRTLFKDTFARTGRRETNYDVSADGSRFLMVEVLPKEQPPLMLVTGIH